MEYESNPWMIVPFGLLLAAMALGPLVFPQWWQRHYGKVALALGAIPVGYYLLLLTPAATETVERAGKNYLSFIALVGSLFVVCGGIHVRVKQGMGPVGNVLFLLIGAMLANVVGTVGAALLLIRPWLRCNEGRLAAYHVVFFIFLVCNVGGCLLPFGNPPLFMGYLMGVPVGWVAQRCWPMWAMGVGFLLGVFYFLDRRNNRATDKSGSWGLDGLPNLFFLAMILAAVFVDRPAFLSEGIMLAAAAASYFLTSKEIHAANHFDFHPIIEVAVLFVGIFATMMPALDWLQGHAREVLGNEPSPAAVFWGAGTMSSLLDNAPAYLSFLAAIFGTQGQGLGHRAAMAELLQDAGLRRCVEALSVGAVFFGGCTYIGNAPNFMVKSLAERRGVALPGFLGYVLKWALPVMGPLLLLEWLLFFR